MQFTTFAAFVAAMAAPAVLATTEDIHITDYILRKTNTTVDAVSFTLSGDSATNVSCSRGATPRIPSAVLACGDSPYRFGLSISPVEGDSSPALSIYHETGPAVGLWGAAPAPPTYCHAGGSGPLDYVCIQTTRETIIKISS